MLYNGEIAIVPTDAKDVGEPKVIVLDDDKAFWPWAARRIALSAIASRMALCSKGCRTKKDPTLL